MKLVAIPDVDGDALSIIDSNFPPESFIPLDNAEDIMDKYDPEDIIRMIVSFNE